MQTKLVSKESDDLAQIVVDAALAVSEKTDSGFRLDIDDVKVEKKAGGSIRDTKLVKGIVLDKEIVHGGMPNRIEKAKDRKSTRMNSSHANISYAVFCLKKKQP